MTITCDRLRQVDFSSVYFDAHQRVLVPDNSAATGGLADLGGQKVCATKGSDSVTTIQDYPTHPKVVQEPFWTDCLVLLQQDQVAAVSTDDAILYGLQAQDPFTKVVGPELTDEPYGLAMSKAAPGLRPLRQRGPRQAKSQTARGRRATSTGSARVYQKPPTPRSHRSAPALLVQPGRARLALGAALARRARD